MAKPLQEITVALDWTPNTNHVGFYAARALGKYRQFGLSVKFISPHSDNYQTTPASKVAAKDASELMTYLCFFSWFQVVWNLSKT